MRVRGQRHNRRAREGRHNGPPLPKGVDGRTTWDFVTWQKIGTLPLAVQFLVSVDLTILLTQSVTMIRINVHGAKTHLSRYLAKLAPGETLLLCRRNVPVAEIRRLPARRVAKRPIGLAKAVFQVPRSFLEPLPEEELTAWDGLGQ